MNLDRVFWPTLGVLAVIAGLSIIASILMLWGIDVEWARLWLAIASGVTFLIGIVAAIFCKPKAGGPR